MKPQGQHGMLPQSTHDEAVRESCVGSMRRFFTTELIPGNRQLYQSRLLPQFRQAHDRDPQTGKEVRELMEGSYFYRASSLFGRATQELLWDTVGEGIERQLPELIDKARPKPDALGTLTIDPDLEMPAYIEAVDIHVMPGNFQTELCEDDVLAGALYDRGAYVFSYGGRGPFMENLGRNVATLIKERFPDFAPRRILEMGCGCGANTVPLKQAWPDAEVHAIDIGAPMVRYGHARAESLGVPIHFSQQNAAKTNFPDEHFDLVVSMLVHHEMPLGVIKQNLAECHRLLVPGGITLTDGSLKGDKPASEPFKLFMNQWFARHNNEPFGKGVDIERDFQDAGFALEDMFSGQPASNDYLKGQLDAHSYVGAVKR